MICDIPIQTESICETSPRSIDGSNIVYEIQKEIKF